MTDVTLNFDETNDLLVLEGDVSKLARYPLIKSVIATYGGAVRDDNIIVIPCAPTELDSLNRLVGEALDQYDIRFAYGDELSDAMEEVKRREERFANFSEKAAAIWLGQYDAQEFKDFVTRIERECPGRSFYPLQLLSAYHLAFSQNACNFSVPGSGKTSVVYAAYAYLNSLGSDHEKFVNHILIVGPLSSFKVWEDEFRIIFGRSPDRQRLAGGVDASKRMAYLRGYSPNSGSSELTLTHYQTLASSEEHFQIFLQSQSRRVMMVLDEAHKIKRPDGVWAASALRLAPAVNARVVLTGTPAPNGYEDLRNLFDFIYPERDVIRFNTAALSVMSEDIQDERIEIMRGRIRPFFVRIRKSDLGLPDIDEQCIEVTPGKTHTDIYSRIEGLIVPKLGSQPDHAVEFLTRARLMRLRQAATNPSLLLRPLEEEFGDRVTVDPLGNSDRELFGMIESFDPREDLTKLDTLRGLISNLQGQHPKILVWSVFIQNLDLIEESVKEDADWVHTISGRTPIGSEEILPEDEEIETRERLIGEFLSVEGTAILVANPQVVGESISLHQGCHVAIYFDRDFNGGLFIQSKDRIHRYGLPSDTLTSYYYLTTQESVEEDIHDRLRWKELRLAELIDTDDIPLFSTVLGGDEEREDIKAIIMSYERRKSK